MDEALSTVCTGAVLFRAAQSLIVLPVFIGMLNEVHKLEIRHFSLEFEFGFVVFDIHFHVDPQPEK